MEINIIKNDHTFTVIIKNNGYINKTPFDNYRQAWQYTQRKAKQYAKNLDPIAIVLNPGHSI